MSHVWGSGTCKEELRSAYRFIFMCGVNQDHPGHIGWVHAVVYTDIQSAEGPSGEDVGGWNACTVYQMMQVRCDGCAGSWIRSRIAPTLASPVIPACCRELGQLGLYVSPHVAWTTCGFKNYRWSTGTRAKDIQPSAADVDRS